MSECDEKTDPVDDLEIVCAVNAIGEVSKGALTEQEFLSACLADEVLQEGGVLALASARDGRRGRMKELFFRE
ncbi:hypothetical protein NDU88_006327 [Pleurodeles waltl]|uniref:Uncharacterized protein n=1 Tax=Pleurodeles waltl TaxID=8319 RepID=A0AAV7X0Y9_PLEWA|nr:hypothetical protein NDU88_006327 [Pleurodeles waltl]